MKPIAVIALGGNALLRKGEKISINVQIKNAKRAMSHIAPFSKKYSLVITHGNGPQVGNILIRSETAIGRAYKLPLDVCVAESEGEIGYILEQSLISELNKINVNKPVITILTQVLVDKKDNAFKNPTKPIGPFYTQSHVKIFKKKKIPFVKEFNKGYRRVVPSPKPIRIIESKVINKIIKDSIIICAGGGGIPIIKEKGKFVGVEAVIDKDFASACLAKTIKADYLFILTDTDGVYTDFGTKKQKRIKCVTVNELIELSKKEKYPPGSMGPKVESAIDFLKNGGKKVIITLPKNLQKAISGKAGTTIIP